MPLPARAPSRVRPERHAYTRKGYRYYFPSFHVARFGFKERGFLKTLTRDSRILEIGAGHGRLARYILSHSPVRPSHYFLVDPVYASAGRSFLDVGLRSAFKGVHVLAGDLFHPALRGRAAFDRILVPQSFFPEENAAVNTRLAARERRGKKSTERDPEFEGLMRVIRQYFPFLRTNGELYVGSFYLEELEHARGSPRGTLAFSFFHKLDKWVGEGRIEYAFTEGAFRLKRLR